MTSCPSRVADALGKALKPEKVLFTRDLPKTRSAKIMRRVIRATHLGQPAGDVSSLENPDAITAIAARRSDPAAPHHASWTAGDVASRTTRQRL